MSEPDPGVEWIDDPDMSMSMSPQPNGHDQAAKGLRFAFTRFADIKLGSAPAYTVHELIPRLGVVVIWGRPKCGKTFWTFDIEMHVALGWPYRGRRVEQGEVLHIACEGVAGLAARKEAWRLYHTRSHPPEALDEAPFHLCKETSLDLIRDAATVAADIFAQFGDRPIRIITIDTLNRSLKGSESKDEDMAAYVRAAVHLAEKFQCCVLIVHHCGYDTTHPRGHTSLIGAVDADVEVKRDEADHILTEVNNMRDGANGAQTCSHLEVVEVGRDDNGDPIFSCVIAEAEPSAPAKPRGKGDRPPSPMAVKFYEAFNNAGAQAAEQRHEAGNRQSITEDQWSAELTRRGLLDPMPAADDDKASQRSAEHRRTALLSKYRRELVAANWLACNSKIVWSVKEQKP